MSKHSTLAYDSAFAAGLCSPVDVLAFHAARFGSALMVEDSTGAGDGNDGGDAGKGDGDTGKGDQPSDGDESKLGDAGKRALQAERAARTAAEQKFTALEGKFDGLLGGLKTALGVEAGKDGDDAADLAGKLQVRLDQLEHTNLVSDVARRHGIVEDKDVELLAAIRDKDVMEQFAARIKPTGGDGSDKDRDRGKRRPAPDHSQGRGGTGTGARPSSVAQVMADRATARAAK